VERIGKTHRYRLTALGLKLGVLLVKARTRLLGPLAPSPPNPAAGSQLATPALWKLTCDNWTPT